MKRHITVEQLKELSVHEYNTLYLFIDDRIVADPSHFLDMDSSKKGEDVLVEIARKIDIIVLLDILVSRHPDYSKYILLEINNKTDNCIYGGFRQMEDGEPEHEGEELCDVLWEALKTRL